MPRIFWTALFLSLIPIAASRADSDTVTVFSPQVDGFKSIRIPSVVVAPHGTVLAIAEGRAANSDQAQNKLILKRSMDKGKNWSPVSVIVDGGERSLNNPCAVVERKSDRVLLIYQSYPAGVHE